MLAGKSPVIVCLDDTFDHFNAIGRVPRVGPVIQAAAIVTLLQNRRERFGVRIEIVSRKPNLDAKIIGAVGLPKQTVEG